MSSNLDRVVKTKMQILTPPSSRSPSPPKTPSPEPPSPQDSPEIDELANRFAKLNEICAKYQLKASDWAKKAADVPVNEEKLLLGRLMFYIYGRVENVMMVRWQASTMSKTNRDVSLYLKFKFFI